MAEFVLELLREEVLGRVYKFHIELALTQLQLSKQKRLVVLTHGMARLISEPTHITVAYDEVLLAISDRILGCFHVE